MDIKIIKDKLQCQILTQLKDKLIKKIIISDLVSDILTEEEEIDLIMSSLSSEQVLRAANILGVDFVLILNDKPVMQTMIDLANELNICLLKSKIKAFDACGIIYQLLNKDNANTN